MTLERILVRDGLTALLSGSTIAETRVQPHRPDVAWEEETPSLFVWTRRERITNAVDTPRDYRRELEVIVEGHASKTATAEAVDVVDLLLAECELILERNRHLPTIDGIRIDPDASGLEEASLDSTSQGRTTQAGGALVWRVVYFTKDPGDSSLLDCLLRQRIEWDLGGTPDGLLEAVDLVTLSP